MSGNTRGLRVVESFVPGVVPCFPTQGLIYTDIVREMARWNCDADAHLHLPSGDRSMYHDAKRRFSVHINDVFVMTGGVP
ncbi:Protein of unknown function [Pyronema omphalodes CBS 100304]|uniref:Uncharacterized protein n=1 Tax=Pyronema omphalodes (strain CBS 100304) TaxID=1076935 RepID=U4LM57_PYROM|nr:Protein of unknown function [Pyronema omphalodes CBS 100304]